MKKLLKFAVRILIRLWSHIYTYGVNQYVLRVHGAVYSLWVSNFLGEVGDNAIFARPLILQGGGQRRIKVGSHTGIGHHTVLGSWERYGENEQYEPEIIIGNNCNIGEYCHITAINKIIINDGVLTGRFVYIGDNSHGKMTIDELTIPPAQRKLHSKGEIEIGKNVWIGDRATILAGVHIGDNVVIGANSVVTHDIPSNSMAAGVPAKVIKKLELCQNQD